MNLANIRRERIVRLGAATNPHDERQAVAEFASFLGAEPSLVGPDGGRHLMPTSLRSVLLQAIPILAHGDDVAVVPSHKTLTTQEAADLLNVSRQYVVRLTDKGKLPFTRTGTHRRVRYEDVLAYKQVRDGERRKGLRHLTRLSRDLGLYTVRDAQTD